MRLGAADQASCRPVRIDSRGDLLTRHQRELGSKRDAEALRRRARFLMTRGLWSHTTDDPGEALERYAKAEKLFTKANGLIQMNRSVLARQPNPLPNPFRPGNGVPPPCLAGRERVLAAFGDWLVEQPPLHANWSLTGLRGTGKTVLLGEFATRAERAGWIDLHRELGDRHRDDHRFAEAIVEDAEALMRRADAIAAVGQAIERGARWLRPKRITVGEVSVDPSYEAGAAAPADTIRRALAELAATLSHTERPGAVLLYDEGHVLADDRARERYPVIGSD